MLGFIQFRRNLKEASFARLVEKAKVQDIAIITAYRSCNSESKNLKRNKMLEADLKSAGFQHYKAVGRYIEGYDPNIEDQEPSDERVFIVFSKDGEHDKKMLDVMKKLGYKYNQDSILYKFAGKPDGWLYRTQDEDRDCNIGNPVTWPDKNGTNVGVMRIREGEFMSVFKGKKFMFVYDEEK